MNLWLRLIWLLVTAGMRAPLTLPADASRVSFRVWPHDLDPSMHMNNGRYLTIMDLGRLDILLRAGLLRAALKYKWTPIANAIVIRFRRELRLFQKFEVVTRLLYWDDARVVMEQVFVFEGGRNDGQIAARALFKGGLYDRAAKQFVSVTRLMEAIGVTAVSPGMSAEVAAFLKSDETLRDVDRA
jgi:acyl-CoA thioesterase FadM